MKSGIATALIATLMIYAGACCAPVYAQQTGPTQKSNDEYDEPAMGKELFNELRSQGEIVVSSPLYATLRPLAERITRVVQPQYSYPIHFYIVHEAQPNAFAAPGGNIYVTDALFYFVRNTEELTGTICHETSHLLYHDSAKKIKDEQEIAARALGATVLLGPSVATVLAVTTIGRLDALHFSREVEERADLRGSDTCALAGYNPWGLVWLFSDFSNADLSNPPEVLSDHPDFAHRISALERHFEENPARFASFNSNARSATPLHVPKNESEKFLRG
ncbi:MAG: M48 family metalloprotease [Candidatus Eremiobacteraeota bacterium]|nr:M48 family metalloprotease [Candidatus Eremiobacteraeota bacterium]